MGAASFGPVSSSASWRSSRRIRAGGLRDSRREGTRGREEALPGAREVPEKRHRRPRFVTF
jgi:hypothetical protein